MTIEVNTWGGSPAFHHCAWALDMDGLGFSLDEFDEATYIGVYIDDSATESTDPEDYQWRPIGTSILETAQAIDDLQAQMDDALADTFEADANIQGTQGASDTGLGNPNMLRRTNQGTTGWTAIGDLSLSALTDTIYDESAEPVSFVRVTCSAAGDNALTFDATALRAILGTLSDESSLTISCDVRMSDLFTVDTVAVQDADGTNAQVEFDPVDNEPVDTETMDTSGTWMQYISTAVAPGSVDESAQVLFFDLSNMPAGATLDIANLKIELGAIATPWRDTIADVKELAEDAAEAASSAMTAANGKNKVFHQATAPASSVGLQTGDTWFDTADGYKMYTWGGSSWAAEQFGVNAIADLSITNAKIANGTIESAKISTLDAGKITSGTIATARLDVNAIFAQNVTATGTIAGATLTGGSITGSTITTTSGSIGGWSIGQYMLYTNTSANRIFLQQADGSSRVNVFAIQSLTDTSYYPFRIAYDGTLVSRNQDQYVKLDSGNLYFGHYGMSGAIPRIYGYYDNESGKELTIKCGTSCISLFEQNMAIDADANNGCDFYCPVGFDADIYCNSDFDCYGNISCDNQIAAGSVRSGRFTDSASNIVFQRYKNGSNPEYPIYWNNAGILRIATKTTNKTPASDNGTSFIIANGLYAAGSVDSTPSVTSAHVYLAGGCDATSRWIGSPAVYGRTYNAAANVYVTNNGYLGRSTSSSIKYKRDVEYLTNEGYSAINKGEPHPSRKGCDQPLDSVLNIPVVTFKYNEGYVTGESDFDYDKPIAGFIAEDVARVCPECATYIEDENGDRVPEAWDAKQLLVRMLYVLQKQQDEIKQLKERMVS